MLVCCMDLELRMDRTIINMRGTNSIVIRNELKKYIFVCLFFVYFYLFGRKLNCKICKRW